MDGTIRANIKRGDLVNIILKKDQRTGVLTEGIVKDILTSAPKHHRGIKVRLEDGQIGRVQDLLKRFLNKNRLLSNKKILVFTPQFLRTYF